MKTIFDKSTTADLVSRLEKLTPENKTVWGKMNAYQMLKHCSMSEELFQGKIVYPRMFMGRLFGKMALKGVLKNDLPIRQNQPTHKSMKITGTGDFEAEKQKMITLLKDYQHFSSDNFVHPFFGKMTQKQIGELTYKHMDHHLRQFGV